MRLLVPRGCCVKCLRAKLESMRVDKSGKNMNTCCFFEKGKKKQIVNTGCADLKYKSWKNGCTDLLCDMETRRNCCWGQQTFFFISVHFELMPSSNLQQSG